MPKLNGVYISYCGLICQLCPAFRTKNCEGCDVHTEACNFAKCAKDKGLISCFLCDNFPCNLHKEGFLWETDEFGTIRWKVFSDIFVKIFRPGKA